VSVRIYVEGGGDNEDSITRCRQGFAAYCANVAPGRNRPRIVPCGGRNQTFDKFRRAVETSKTGEVQVLLVDSESGVSAATEVEHLRIRDRWDFPTLSDHHIFLMVECVESWFLADREALASFYDGGFSAKSLSGSPKNIEVIQKQDVANGLKKATVNTKTKGEYHKIVHGSALLARINPALVERASPHAKRLHDFLRTL